MYGTLSAHQRWDHMPATPTHASAEYAEIFGAVMYALRLADGTIKIGITGNLHKRLMSYRAAVGENPDLLAIKQGTHADEQAIHRQLTDHVKHGREWYHPHAEVLAIVNDWRADLNMEPLPIP